MMEVQILVDADACPVKEEVFKTAYRLKVPVRLVANSYFRIPDHPLITLEVVSDQFDAADDRIVELCDTGSVVVTSDILLAARALECEAHVLSPKGKPWTASNIGGAVATRALMADLRAGVDGVAGGPPPFVAKDRSEFLNALDRELNRLLRIRKV